MELRILRRKVEPFDAGFPVYGYVWQYRTRYASLDERAGSEWKDIPIVNEEDQHGTDAE